jgi:hypothetical protein
MIVSVRGINWLMRNLIELVIVNHEVQIVVGSSSHRIRAPLPCTCSSPPGFAFRTFRLTSENPISSRVCVASLAASSCLRSVVEVEHAVVVRLAVSEREFAGCGVVGEQARPVPPGQRVDEEMELVDQAVREHGSD